MRLSQRHFGVLTVHFRIPAIARHPTETAQIIRTEVNRFRANRAGRISSGNIFELRAQEGTLLTIYRAADADPSLVC